MESPELNKQETFNRLGFQRESHTADKVGKYADYWKGQIVLTSLAPVLDEIQTARDLEVLVTSGAFPMHGLDWRVSYINFHWKLTGEERELYGDIKCLIRLGYLSRVDGMTAQEFAARMEILGLEKLLDQQGF